MPCRKTEELILRSFDQRLDDFSRAELDVHLENCSRCRRRQKEYAFIFETLRQEKMPETKPYFWERLQPKIKKRGKIEPWRAWKQIGLKAIPLSLLLVILLAAAAVFLSPPAPQEFDLSQTGNFLLQNVNPLTEIQPYLSEEGGVNKHLMLIFSSLDETESIRRYFP